MPIKYIPYQIKPLKGQAVLPFLRYHQQNTAKDFQLKGIPYFGVDLVEKVNQSGDKANDNLVIHGDCLNACAYLKDKDIKVDLVYIDPPFASGANYAKKIFIRQNPKLVAKLEEAEKKLKAEAGEEVDNSELQTLEETMYGDIWQKEDYLNWLYERLLAIKEVMSETASIYVHLDWHIGHYVKVLLDEIFGEENFRNEIIWGYRTGGTSKNTFAKKHDTILFYSKSDNYNFNTQYYRSYQEKKYNFNEKYPEIYDEGVGKWYHNSICRDVWEDLYPVGTEPGNTERTDYATQKPEVLLERIIKASSNKGMTVVDFFGGSGVAVKVANDLDRKFITSDVGINAIQTIRDRLVESGVSFDILKIKDGIDLFRNPQQTMDKLASIIPGLTIKHEFSDFWFGAMVDKGVVCPCWVPNLLDKNQAILNPALFSKILDETVKLEGVSKVIVCSIDIVEIEEINKMIKDYDLRDSEGKSVEFIFKDLKELIDLLVSPDSIEYKITQKDGKIVISFERFVSDYLMQKIDEFNSKKKASQKKIEISDEGLELIEYISIDSSNVKGVWKSDHEIKIDKKGYMIVDGNKTKNFWDGTIASDKKPLRLKVRNIAGDEIILSIEK